MEEYTFEEQIAIMHNCEIVVAPHGAGLTNILFCQPGVTVIELLADKYPASCFYRMAVLCGHKYYPILGTLTEEKDWNNYQDFYENFRWEVDIIKLHKLLEKVML
jgi:capsular polysaccharide biosynthesis protein